MKGRQVFMESLRQHGVRCIFGNPGTTENPLLDSLIDYPDIPYYVALHEGVAVGAAGFFAQASATVGVANVHVAPGLGNAIGMIYGALKANSPLIVTAGAQDTRMRLRDPLLGHDLVAMAEPVTKWSAQPRSADEIGPMMQRAFKIAQEAPAGPVFIGLPVDVMSADTDIPATSAGQLYQRAGADPAGIAAAADLLHRARMPVIVAGDDVARGGATDALIGLAETAGAAVYVEALHAQMAFPNRHPHYAGGLPVEAARIRAMLGDADLVLLIGGPFFEEVWFDQGSPFPDGTSLLQLEPATARLAHNYSLDVGLVGDLESSLSALTVAFQDRSDQASTDAARARAETLRAAHAATRAEYEARVARHGDALPMSPDRALAEIARALPADVVIVDESITAGGQVGSTIEYRRPGDYFGGRGGGIGQGLAGAIGVAVALPQRPVVCVSGDGSAMYSIQALWSAAHHQLPIVFIILANREYRVLKHNMDIYRQRFDADSNRPYPHMDLTKPTVGFVDVARGMGVEGVEVTDPTALADAVSAAIASGKPHLIEVLISGKTG